MDIHFILQNLTANRVNIPILSNEFHESTLNVTQKMLSPYEGFRNLLHIAGTPTQSGPPPPLSITVKDTLLSAFYIEFEDPSVSLLSAERVNAIIRKYKDILLLSVKKEEISVAVMNPEREVSVLLPYLAKYYKTNITFNGQLYHSGVKSNKKFIVLKFNTTDNQYTFEKDEQIEILKQYDVNQLLQNLKKTLAKEVKDIAIKLDLPLTKEENGKKKPLLKDELIQQIQQQLLK